MFGTIFRDSRLVTGVMLLSALLSGQALAADSEDAAAYDQHYPEIKYPLLRKAIDAGEVFLIDANSTETYQKGHLPSARSITNRKKLEGELPVLKNYPIAVYCGGPQCSAWHSAADFAAARGYTNVMHFKGGLKVWKEQGDTLSTGSGS
ncbi:MAG: rhodanese-like domain-containing protein [Endozoicomonas sp.]